MGKTIVVSKRMGDFSSIQKAIDHASSGDRIEIRPGRYKENLKIEKEIDLIGDDPGKVTVAVKDSDSFFVNIGTEDFDVTLKNLSFARSGRLDGDRRASDWAIVVFGVTTVNIKNCIIKEGFAGGIELADATNARLVNNVIEATRTVGISASTRGKVTGTNNEIYPGGNPLSGNAPGGLRKKLLESKQDKIVWPNDEYESFQHAVDALLPGGKLLLERGVYEIEATIDKEMTIKSNSKKRPLITKGAEGLALVGGAKLTMKGVTFTELEWSAVHLGANAEARLVDCEVRRGQNHGIWLSDNSRATVIRSNISDNQRTAVGLTDSAEALVKNSELSHNSRGVELNLKAEVTLIGNDIHHNLAGIEPRSHYVPFKGDVRGYGNSVYRNKYNFATMGKAARKRLTSSLPDSCPVRITDESKIKSGANSSEPRCFNGSIREAIEEAKPGSRIILTRDQYVENLEIEKALTLKAAEGADVTIVGQEPHLPVISVGDRNNSPDETRDVVLDNLTVRRRKNLIPPFQEGADSASGIEVISNYHLDLVNSTVTGNKGTGVEFLKGSSGTIEGSKITDNESGLLATGYYVEVDIKDTTITRNSQEGAVVTFSPVHSYCKDLPKEPRVSITDSVISHNGGNGVEVSLHADLNVTETVFKSNRIGLVASFCPIIELRKNEFTDNRHYGVVLGPKHCPEIAQRDDPKGFSGKITGADNLFSGKFDDFICEKGYPGVSQVFKRIS